MGKGKVRLLGYCRKRKQLDMGKEAVRTEEQDGEIKEGGGGGERGQKMFDDDGMRVEGMEEGDVSY